MLLRLLDNTQTIYAPKDDLKPRFIFLRDHPDVPGELDLVDCWVGGNIRGNFFFLREWDQNISEVQLNWLFQHASPNPTHGNLAWYDPAVTDHFEFIFYSVPSNTYPIPKPLCTQKRELVRDIKDNS